MGWLLIRLPQPPESNLSGRKKVWMHRRLAHMALASALAEVTVIPTLENY